MNKIIKNCIKCNCCGDIFVSKNRHDYKWCTYGVVAVDSGKEYLRRSLKNSIEDYIEMSEFEEQNN